MPKLVVTNREGETSEIDVEDGLTVMEAIRDNGFDELLALCGGCCSCATCHVYIDEGGSAGMPEMTEDEDDLLESSDHRKDTSRLSCQIPLTADLDGLKVTLAPKTKSPGAAGAARQCWAESIGAKWAAKSLFGAPKSNLVAAALVKL